MNRWGQVALASVFINTSYGTLSYAFSVLVTEQAAGGELGKGAIAVGFGLALLVSGVASVGVGTIADLFGTRRMMAGGSVVGAAGLALLGACQEPWQAIVVMVVFLGPAMAATFYEPVYVLMNRWFTAEQRPRAYGVLTLMSGVSITIFTPLTQWLVEAYEWRTAVVVLGGILLVVGLLVPLFLREGEREAKPPERTTPRTFLRETADGLRQTDARFWVFSLAFFAATVAFSGFAFHMIAQLETRGFDEAAVARAIAVTGLVSLPMRLLLPSLTARWPSNLMLAVCLGMLGVAAWIASGAGEWWQVWVYVAVFGAVYPLRALITSEGWAGPYFGRVIGVQALLVAVARAAGPVAVSAIGTDREAYELGFRVAAVVLVVSSVVVWWSMRRGRRQGVRA